MVQNKNKQVYKYELDFFNHLVSHFVCLSYVGAYM